MDKTLWLTFLATLYASSKPVLSVALTANRGVEVLARDSMGYAARAICFRSSIYPSVRLSLSVTRVDQSEFRDEAYLSNTRLMGL